MRCRHCYNGLSPTLQLFVHMTDPNTSIEPRIVDYLLAWKSVGARGKIAVRRGRQDSNRIEFRR